MSALMVRTHQALRLGRLHDALAAARPTAIVADVPCIGHDVAALQTAVADLMARHTDDLSDEARTILRTIAPLAMRCKQIWRDQ